MVQAAPEVPLIHCTTASTGNGCSTEPPEDPSECVQLCIPDYEDQHAGKQQLDLQKVLIHIPGWEYDHHCSREDEIKRVQGADIVQDVSVSHCPAQQRDRHVQAPEHLQHSHEANFVLDGKDAVPKAGQPDERRYQDPDNIVHLHSMVIMVDQDDDCHPTLPLLCHLSV